MKNPSDRGRDPAKTLRDGSPPSLPPVIMKAYSEASPIATTSNWARPVKPTRDDRMTLRGRDCGKLARLEMATVGSSALGNRGTSGAASAVTSLTEIQMSEFGVKEAFEVYSKHRDVIVQMWSFYSAGTLAVLGYTIGSEKATRTWRGSFRNAGWLSIIFHRQCLGGSELAAGTGPHGERYRPT